MKKLLTAWGVLLVFLLGSYFVPTNKHAQKTTTTANIGILQLMIHPALDQIRQGIIAGLKQSGYVVGKNLTIDYQNAQNDQSNLTSMAQRFASENVNLAIGIATPAAQTLAQTFNQNSGTAVVMAGISDPVGAKLVTSLTHPGKNITGTRHQEPLQKQISLIKQLTPSVKKIGVIYTSSDDSSAAATSEFYRLAKKAGYQVKLYGITSTNDITQTASTAASQSDAIYVPQDNTVTSGISALLKVTNAAKIPVYAAAGTMVAQGAFATVATSQYQLGVATGKMAAAILDGKNPASYAVQTPQDVEYYVNTTTAKKLGINLTTDFIKQVKQKGVIYQ